MAHADPAVRNAYLAFLEQAIVRFRCRIRDGERISQDEMHDFLDALHNVPHMLRDYGNWFVEANVDRDLARYDEKWAGARVHEVHTPALASLLRRAREGEFDP